jgi:transcription antitermination factor NusG
MLPTLARSAHTRAYERAPFRERVAGCRLVACRGSLPDHWHEPLVFIKVMTEAWYVCTTHLHAEHVAEVNLQRQGFCTRLFKRNETLVVRGEKKSRVVLMFPGYLFVQMDVARQRWQAVNNTRGVRHLLPLTYERPVPLAADAMGWLARQEQDFGRIVVGRVLQILSGPYRGTEVAAQSVDEKRQIINAIVALFGRPLVVSLGFHAVRALDRFESARG